MPDGFRSLPGVGHFLLKSFTQLILTYLPNEAKLAGLYRVISCLVWFRANTGLVHSKAL